MNSTVDGEFQRYAVESGAYIRQHFFGPDPRLRKMVEHLSDDELRNLPRGGHDYKKLYAAYKAAVEHEGTPTVILAKTVKGWTLGPDVEGRNATHQIKKMESAQVRAFRDRLFLHDEIPDSAIENGMPSYYMPPADSPAMEYLRQRRAGLDGSLPKRSHNRRGNRIDLPDDKIWSEFLKGSGNQAASTTMVFARLLRNLVRDEKIGDKIVPIIPDEARTFGLD